MRVFSFNLGMGPVLLRKRGKETVYQIKAIPFGGSVQLGEDEDEETEDPRAFRNKPVWQRAIVIVAGAVMNIVLGFVLCLIITSMNERVDTTEIRGFREGAVSNQLLQAGDRITHINGMRIFTWMDVSYQFVNTEMKMAEDEYTVVFDFTVIRNGEKVHLHDVPFLTRPSRSEEGKMAIVLDFGMVFEDKTFFNVISRALGETISLSRIIIMTLFDLIRGTYGLNDIAGPVGVVSAIGEVSSKGFAESFIAGIKSALFMAALISVNVGIFNLLPIPALDGARIVFFIIEAIRRKPLKAEVEGMIHFIGFAALMLFMLLITVLDIGKLIS
jgi:regulator of sigma E protease